VAPSLCVAKYKKTEITSRWNSYLKGKKTVQIWKTPVWPCKRMKQPVWERVWLLQIVWMEGSRGKKDPEGTTDIFKAAPPILGSENRLLRAEYFGGQKRPLHSPWCCAPLPAPAVAPGGPGRTRVVLPGGVHTTLTARLPNARAMETELHSPGFYRMW
jgi:hypothetical protein